MKTTFLLLTIWIICSTAALANLDKYFEIDFINADYISLSVSDSNQAVLCGIIGAVVRTNDKGKTWQKSDFDYRTFLRDIKVKDETAIAISINEIFYSADGGKTWNRADSLSNAYIECVVLANSNTGAVFCRSGLIMKTTDGGNNWDYVSTEINDDITSSVATESGAILIATAAGEIYKSSDYCESWEKLTVPVSSFVPMNFSYSFDENLYLLTQKYLLKSTNEGETWSVFNNPADESEYCVYTSGGDGYYIYNEMDTSAIKKVVQDTSVVDTFDIRKEIERPTGTVIKNVKFFNDSCGFAVGLNNLILKTSDAGGTWDIVSYLNGYGRNFFSAIHFINDSVAYVGGYYECLYKTTDYGATWSIIKRERNELINASLKQLYFWNEKKGVMISADYSKPLLKTLDGGETVEREEIDLNGATPSLNIVSGDTLFFKGTRRFNNNWHGYYVFRTFDGDIWNFGALDSIRLLRVYFKNKNNIFITAAYQDSSLLPDKPDIYYKGLLLLSTNQGKSWSRKYFKDYDTINEIHFFNETDGIIFANTDYGSKKPKMASIYRTSDGGKSWTLTDSAIAKGLGGIISFDQKRVLAFAEGIKALFSQDSGYTWEAIDFIENFGVADISQTSEYTYLSGRLGESYPAIVRLKLKEGTSVEESEKTDGLRAPRAYIFEPYPNPAKNFVNFRIVWDKKYDIDELSIKIYDIFGREIKNPDLSRERESVNEAVFKWNTAGMGEGLYIMQLKIGDYSRSRKVIVY